MVVQIDVTGTVALRYMRRELGAGKKLSALIAELPLEAGRITAFVPELTPDDKLFAFDSGGLYVPIQVFRGNGTIVESIENDARPVIVEVINDYLAKDQMHCCLFEDVLSRPTDPFLRDEKIEILFHGEDIYYFISNRTRKVKPVEDGIAFSKSYVFLCALSQMNIKIQDELSPESQLDIDLLRRFVANITSFIVMAYDREGYLMWKK